MSWTRRKALGLIATGVAGAWSRRSLAAEGEPMERNTQPETDPIEEVAPLTFPWSTRDPFLFCAHHLDHYPAGNDRLGPITSLAGRDLGQDFEIRDGFRMYHGAVVPGFPQHPHRGFETITVVKTGLVDHSDSLGASGRYGSGDVQWMTAGSGILHSEMFPLLEAESPNPLELFQIWLNLPARDKLVAPHFKMFWSDEVGEHVDGAAGGPGARVRVIAGRHGSARSPPPPPNSWASRDDSDVTVWLIHLDPGASWTLPAAAPESARTLYFHAGSELHVNGRSIPAQHSVALRADSGDVTLRAGRDAVELLLLRGRPIGEPVAQHGPFVMNTDAEIRQAFADYRRTQFGGWPWPSDDPVHGREEGRFARHADGRVERPDPSSRSG